jgi:O-antigen/teichoic acid export membrane protein
MEAARATYGTLTVMLGFVVVPLCLGLAAVTPILVPLVFGGRFTEAVPAAAVTAAFASMNAIATVGSSYTYAREASAFTAKTGILFAILTPIVYWLVIPRFGVLGAAIARVAIHGAGVAVAMTFIARGLRTHVPIRRLLRIMLASALAAGGGFLVVRWRADWLGLTLALVVMAVSYLLLARPFRCLGSDELDKIEKATQALPGRMVVGLAIAWLRG